ncbi:hypothetical protein GCM10023191_029610 [Actinoallomurus oryzae]|uniref:Uncharacterized protein n=1 Tax=Actinoallomurus oryzae TaxID=502180 RepID=A0ABP8PVJ0_9ACTN
MDTSQERAIFQNWAVPALMLWMLVYSNLYVLLGLAALAAVPFHLRARR